MKYLSITILLFLGLSNTSFGQDKDDIVVIIDDLTVRWDDMALVMKKYEGMKEFCRNGTTRRSTVALLNKIHYYDSVLYNIVIAKFDESGDEEAKKTLDDIVLLETDYTTKSFLKFLHTDCSRVNEVENNYAKKGGSKYRKEKDILEVELNRYVKAITNQVDIVDRHIHHLKGL